MSFQGRAYGGVIRWVYIVMGGGSKIKDCLSGIQRNGRPEEVIPCRGWWGTGGAGGRCSL